ncbi:MAG: substrate-binding domain-containing protein [Lachnospiraceae bacterium]
MKKILLLTDGWRRFIVAAWTTGILQYMKEQGGFSLTQVHCWGNWSHDAAFNRGEYAIFDVPDFSAYDGIIADLTCIENRTERKKVAEMIRASKRPAITLCDKEEGITCVRSANYQAICELFDHLYEVHGCRSFVFAGSRKTDSESGERESAFVDSCRRHGIALTPDDILECDFDAETGILAARQFFDGTAKQQGGKEIPVRKIPDAFICANDNIAVGLLMEMKKHGWECPRDFLVTGFDNLDKAMYYRPQITTVTLNREKLAYTAAKALDRMMRGEKVPDNIHTEAKPVFAESCGCPTSDSVDLRGYLAWKVEDGILVNRINEQFSLAASEFNPSLSMEELMHRAMERYAGMDVDGVYVAIDGRIGSGELEEGYRDLRQLTLFSCCERDSSGVMKEFHVSSMDELTEHLAPKMEGNSFMMLPLHIRNLSAGLIALYNPRFIQDEWRFYEFQDILLHALAEWDSNRQLQNSLSTLREVYYRDLLTGIYSNNAFAPKLLPWLSGELSEGKTAFVYFFDIDGFKTINDTKGHAFGDHILQEAANCFVQVLPKESSFCYRAGGDEFVAVLTGAGQEEVKRIRDQLRTRLLKKGISVSIGISELSQETEHDLRGQLELAIRAADHDMYRWKKLHHAARR